MATGAITTPAITSALSLAMSGSRRARRIRSDLVVKWIVGLVMKLAKGSPVLRGADSGSAA
jgi:hypothetical protein